MNIIPHSAHFKRPHKNMQGVTLIELMISLTIGLIIIAGIGYIFLGSRQGFRSQDALARMQEGARTAFEIMDRDIRMAGYTGCPPNTTASGDINILSAAADWDKNLIGQPLVGYDNSSGASWSSFPAGVTGVVGHVLRGDALTVLHADNSHEYIVFSHNTGTSVITLAANHDLKQGTILVAAKPDCSRTVVFQKTNACTLAGGSCGNTAVQHGSSSAIATYALGSPAGTVDSFDIGSRVYRLNAVTYYIRANDSGEPALYRQSLGTTGTSPTNTDEELIEGVQDMQLVYGIDTNGDKAVDSYVTADTLTTPASWAQVLGIRVSLLMVSRQDEQGITTEPHQYSLDLNGDGDVTGTGETVTPTDLLLRKVFTTTIAVKNRL
jgi:type IV pilus assembly protein PilW